MLVEKDCEKQTKNINFVKCARKLVSVVIE